MNIRRPRFVNDALARFRALERRDQTALLGLTAFFCVLFLYYGVWSPANEFFSSREMLRNRELSLVRYMRSTEDRARASARSGVRAVSGQAMLTQISQTAQQYGISPNRLQPEGTDGVSVWFDDVPFNKLVTWLEQQSQTGIVVRQISIDRAADNGKVRARIVFRS